MVTEALLGAETLLLVLLALFVVALLRSHAEILRRLDALGGELPHHREAAPGGRPAPDLEGATPSGGFRRIAVGAGADTLVAFLSSGCTTCTALLEQLADGPPALPRGTRLVVVAKDRELERLRLFRPLEQVVDVVMSSAAWDAYAAPGSPYFVHVDGATATVAGEGSASRWEQVASLLLDALDDHRDVVDAPRIDDALEAAGIGPGHPSLHPGER